MKKKNTDAVSSTSRMPGRQYLFYLIIISFIVLMLPHTIRFFSGNSTLIGSQAYLHIRIAEKILEGGGIDDDMVYGGRSLVFLPYHYLLAGTFYLTGFSIASKLLPFSLGILSIILFYMILKALRIAPFSRFMASLLLIISPPFIYLFTASTPSCLSISISLLGFYLFLKENRIFFVLSLLCFILASFSGVFNMIFISLILFFFYVWDNTNKPRSFIAILVIAGFYFLHPVKFYYSFEYPVTSILKVLVSDFGAKTGFSPFVVVLGIIGAFHSWKEKGKYYPLYITLIFITISILYIGGESSLYSTFIMTLLASMGLKSLNELQWRFLPIKNLSFILVGCGLLFSTASYMDRMPLSMPNDNTISGLEWLNNNSEKTDVVLSHYSRGYWIEAAAERPAMIDGFSSSIPDFNRKYSDADRIFRSKDLDETANLLRRYNIHYILIDDEMRSGLVWENEGEGLLYLLGNNITFKKVYGEGNEGIWMANVH